MATLGNPQVAFDTRRNYVFGPALPTATGERNVGMGEVALYYLGTGSDNCAVGDQAMILHRSGVECVGVGSLALFGSESRNRVTAIGTAAAQSAGSGDDTTACGRLAAFTTSTRGRDTALGDSALRFLGDGGDMVAIGFRCAETLRSGSECVLAGTLAGLSSTSMHRSVVLGFDAVANGTATMCDEVVAIGAHALAFASAPANTAVGSYAGLATVAGSGNTLVGAAAAAGLAQPGVVTHAIAIGQDVAVLSHQAVIGREDSVLVRLAGVALSVGDLLALRSMLGIRRLTAIATNTSSFWDQDLRSLRMTVQDQHSKPPVPPVQSPIDVRRRLCLSTVIAGAVTACGGGSNSDPAPSEAAPLASERAARAGVAAANRSDGAAMLPLDSGLGSPQVPFDPRRNYVFGPVQPQPSSPDAMANVGLGEGALRSIDSGWANTAVGDEALPRLTSGLNCVAVGASSMATAVSAVDCTAIGAGSLQSIVDGVGATAIGRLACASLTSANNCTGIGALALRGSISGIGNVAVGYAAAESNAAGHENLAVGAQAARWVPAGDRNVAIGFSAMGDARSDTSDNVAVGTQALNTAIGGRNTAVGTQAGLRLTTGSGNIFLGHRAGADERQNPAATNSIAIGDGAYTTQSHQVVIGNDRTEVVVLAGVAFTRTQLTQLAALAAKIRRAGATLD